MRVGHEFHVPLDPIRLFDRDGHEIPVLTVNVADVQLGGHVAETLQSHQIPSGHRGLDDHVADGLRVEQTFRGLLDDIVFGPFQADNVHAIHPDRFLLDNNVRGINHDRRRFKTADDRYTTRERHASRRSLSNVNVATDLSNEQDAKRLPSQLQPTECTFDECAWNSLTDLCALKKSLSSFASTLKFFQ